MEAILAEYIGPVYEWARRKLGADGEDLAQEVLLQVCVAFREGREIHDPERYIWKIARYTWCNWLRSRKKMRMQCSIDDTVLPMEDFANEFADNAEETQLRKRLRREIGELVSQERELMVAHYIDGVSVAEAAMRAGITETSAAWRLHEARRKVRDKLMKSIESYSYNPGRLSVGISGDPGPGSCDAWQISGNLIRENILLICYGQPRSAGDIAEATGVPMCYIERDIEWLYEHEFLVQEGRKYQTAFPINDREHTKMLNGLYSRLGGMYAAAMERINAAENDIRALGFHGDGFAWNRLMWPMLMLFASTCIRTSGTIAALRRDIEYPVHPDGGKYQTSGSVRYDDEDIWHGYNGLVSFYSGYGDGAANVIWLGAYNFGHELIRIVRNLDDVTDSALYDMYVAMADGTLNKTALTPYQQDILAQDIAEGSVTGDLKPDFVVIEAAKLEKLRNEIFAPIARDVFLPALEAEAESLMKNCRSRLPAGVKQFASFETVFDMSEMCYRILEYAGRNGMLCLPENENEGGKLTLVLVK